MADSTAFGTILKIDISATLTLVTKVEEVAFPPVEKVLDEVTNHGSTGGWEEFLDVGLRRSGELDVTLIWDSAAATHAKFQTVMDGTAAVNMSVQDPGGVEIMAFSAHVKKIERLTPKDKALRAKIKIKPTGVLTIT